MIMHKLLSKIREVVHQRWDQKVGVDILLAVYNSSQYVSETIESIIRQDFTQWRLLIRDGGSKDHTPHIIEKYAQAHPDKIVLIPSVKRSGACQNFSALLSRSLASYVMFCDHDDIWLPGKISKSLSLMREQEQLLGAEVPLLLFTDKRVVDDKLSVISDSYNEYQNLNSENLQLSRLLVQNVPSGCTMLINRALIDKCGTIPPGAIMHDHWISLTAAAFGKIIYLDEPTILYRQHIRNVFGASQYGLRYFYHLFSKGLNAARRRFYQNVEQARLFLEHFEGQLSAADAEVLLAFSSLQECSWTKRRRILWRYKILKTGICRNIGMFLIV